MWQPSIVRPCSRTRGCLRPSRQIVAVLAALASACSPRTLVIVDPDPCADGGAANGVPGCEIPDPCPDGGVLIGVSGCVDRDLLDGLVGYWRLDESTGSTIAVDFTGNNNGTLVDLDVNNVWTAGRAAGGLNVAAAGYVDVPRSTSIDSITDQVTLAGWGYLEGTVMDYATIASREDGTTIDQHYHISIDMMDL